MPPHASDPDLATRLEVRRVAATLPNPVLTLKDYHAIGEDMRRLAEDPALGRRGTRWRERVAATVGCSPSTLAKTLQFRTVYSADGLPELAALDVGWARLTLVLGVTGQRQRLRLLTTAEEEGWGERQVQRALQRLRGERRGAAVRQHLDEAERQLKRMTAQARDVRQVDRVLRVNVPAAP